MIDTILGNKTSILVLRFLTRFNGEFFPADEISKATGAGLRNVYDSLKALSYDNIVSKRVAKGKIHYRFIVDSSFKRTILNLFEEEHKKLFLKNITFYKLLSEIESNIIKIAGSNLVEIILYGSVAKGRDTINSDIDICVLINKDNEKLKTAIKRLAYDHKFKREIQIQVLTSEEFKEAYKNENPLTLNITREGASLKVGD